MRIAISGLSGCGNTTISGKVAEALGFKKVNYTFHDLARDLGIPFERLQHEEVEKTDRWDLELDKKLQSLASEDNVVLGSRLACWLVDADLKVWLHAPARVRAKRIAERENREYKETLAETKLRDKENRARYKRIYGVDVRKYEEVVDLVVNNSFFTIEQTTAIIAEAARQRMRGGIKRKPSKWPRKIAEIISEKLEASSQQETQRETQQESQQETGQPQA